MNRITLDSEALRHNLETVRGWVKGHGGRLTVVTKALCGHPESLGALRDMGVRSWADSRLANLRALHGVQPQAETWYLRPPHPSAVESVVALSQVSLNTELAVVKELGAEAGRRGVVHGVVLMVELGDLREGILPGALVKLYREVFDLPSVNVLGIGANQGCLSGTVPNLDQLMQLVLYRELLQLKFDREIPLISGGSSALLPLLLEGRLTKALNHFRVGEAILLGTDLVNGGTLPGLRSDAAVLEAEVVEVKEKGLVPLGETADMTPFAPVEGEEARSPGQRGYRALVNVGQVDTDVSSLRPVDPAHRLAGASSDITVVNLGDTPGDVRVGSTIAFHMGYSGFVRLMANPYTEKRVLPLGGAGAAAAERTEALSAR